MQGLLVHRQLQRDCHKQPLGQEAVWYRLQAQARVILLSAKAVLWIFTYCARVTVGVRFVSPRLLSEHVGSAEDAVPTLLVSLIPPMKRWKAPIARDPRGTSK